MVGDKGNIMRTVDAGVTWTPQLSPVKKDLQDLVFVGKSGWAVGADNTILSTADNGKNWTEQRSGMEARYLLNGVAFLNDKNYSKATIARKLATLRSFYKFLVKTNRRDSNPLTAIRTPKQDKKLPRFLEFEEVKRLLETPPTDSWLGSRDRAILETLYSTGIRLSELIGLRQSDMDFERQTVSVLGKGRKIRLCPIGRVAAAVLERWRREFASATGR